MSASRTSDAESPVPPARETLDLIGQERAESLLAHAAESGRMHHAWLLTGPEGIGKATLSYRLARFMLAKGAGEETTGSGLAVPSTSQAARQVAAQSHPNLITVAKPVDEKNGRQRSTIPVDEIRRLHHFYETTAGAGGWRITIVDSVDHFTVSAANALLKLLEEPPRDSLFLLVSHQPGRLLPTIRSRCQQLALPPLDDGAMAALMDLHAPDLGSAERDLLLTLAEGSIGKALRLHAAGGVDLQKELQAYLTELPRGSVPAAHALADKVARRGAEESFDLFFVLLRGWIHRYTLHLAGGTGPRLAGEERLMERLAAAGPSPAALDRWGEVWENLGRLADRATGLNTDKKLVVLTALGMLEAAARKTGAGP